MEDSEEFLQSVLDKSEASERRARKRAVVLSVIPIMLAVVVLGWTSQRVLDMKAQLDEAEDDLAVAQQSRQEAVLDVNDLTDQADDLEGKLLILRSTTAEALELLDSIKEQIEDHQHAPDPDKLDDLASDIEQATEEIKAATPLSAPRPLYPLPSEAQEMSTRSLRIAQYKFNWTSVPDAVKYILELRSDPQGSPKDRRAPPKPTTRTYSVGEEGDAGTRITGQFQVEGGRNRLSWRVWAIDAVGWEGEKSKWVVFYVER